MDSRSPALNRVGPIARAVFFCSSAFGGDIKSKEAARAIVLSAPQTKNVCKRGFAPMQGDLCWLKPGRGARQVATNANGPRRLKGYSAAPGLGFKLQLPAAR